MKLTEMKLTEEQEKYKQIFDSEIDITLSALTELHKESGGPRALDGELEKTLKKQEPYLDIKKCVLTGYDVGKSCEVYGIRTASIVEEDAKEYLESATRYIIKHKDTSETIFISEPVDAKRYAKDICVKKQTFRDDIKREDVIVETLSWYSYPIALKILEETDERITFSTFSESGLEAMKIVQVHPEEHRYISYELPYKSRFR